MNNLTKQDIGNIIALVNQSSIKGMEAPTVSQLLDKLGSIFNGMETPSVEVNSPHGEGIGGETPTPPEVVEG